MKKHLFFLHLSLLCIVFLALSQPVFALEVDYPVLPSGLGTITSDTSISEYLVYLFSFSVIISGTLGIISIVVAGINILLNAGNPSARSAATERIFNSILGIILLLFSIVILRTINPDLVGVREPKFGATTGVYLTGSNKIKPAPRQITNTADPKQFDPSYGDVWYNCTPPGKTILVSTFDKPNFEVTDQSKTIRIECGGSSGGIGSGVNLGGIASFKWEYEDAGVYYFLGPNCSGLVSEIQKSKGQVPIFGNQSVADMDGPPNGLYIKSVRIVSGTDSDKRYGVILNKETDGSGECSVPLLNPTNSSRCFSLNISPYTDLDGYDFDPLYGYVIRVYPENKTSTASRGITLYSNNYFVYLSATEIGSQYSVFPGFTPFTIGSNGYNATPDQFMHPACSLLDINCPNGGGKGRRSNTDSQPPPPYECAFGDPDRTCISSIEPEDNFYTVLYARDDIDLNQDGFLDYYNDYVDRSCRIYNNGVSNLKDDADFLRDYRALYRMDIFPSI